MYRERASRIAGAVAWTKTADDESDVRVLPDGCIDLIWDGAALFVAGPDTHAHMFAYEPGTQLAAVRFAPGHGPKVVGVPASELTDQRVSVADLWPRTQVERVHEALLSAADPATVIEDLATSGGERDPLIDRVVAMAGRGDGVADIADEVGFSDRQLQRRCLDAFGYGAKTLAKILRLTRALAIARSGQPFADTAIVSGYSDQAHLSRDVRQFTGVTLRQLVR